MISKGQLEIVLSRLEGFPKPKVRLEQYVMDSKIGAEILHKAYLLGDIEGKVVIDLGCGTGILGIGALIEGAVRVFFVDIDTDALEIAKINLNKAKSECLFKGEAVFIQEDVVNLKIKGDTVIENPPFGVKVRHNDKKFLAKAFETADVVYHFGKIEGRNFVNKFSADNGQKVRNEWEFEYPIKSSYGFHKKKIHRFKAGCWKISKNLLMNLEAF